MAKLVPVDSPARPHLAKLKGWLDEDDVFFDAVYTIVEERRIVRKWGLTRL